MESICIVLFLDIIFYYSFLIQRLLGAYVNPTTPVLGPIDILLMYVNSGY